MPLFCLKFEIYFHWERILCGQLFSFSALNMLFHSLLPCIISNKQPSIRFVFVPLDLMCLFFSGYILDFFFFIKCFEKCMMCLEVVFSLLFALRICWTFEIYLYIVCIKHFFVIIFQVLFSPPFPHILSFEDSNFTSISLLEIVVQLINILLFFPSSRMFFIALCSGSEIFSAAMSNLPLILHSAYFASETAVFLSPEVQFMSLFYLPFSTCSICHLASWTFVNKLNVFVY